MAAYNIFEPTIDESELTYHELIGRGGFGDIYRVTWHSKDLGEVEAAAKKVHIPKNRQDIPKDLQNEVRFLKTLKHPSIIEFYGLAITLDHVVLVTEYAAKGSLFDYLQHKTELPRDLKTKWAIQAAKGLKYLRDKDVLHRDIKSPNLLITGDDDLKICDFGISKDLTSTKTTKHADKGSIKWQAPEIFKDELLSPKADIFAFGVVLWEMETCEEPYKGKIACHIMFKVGSEDARPEIPDTCPPALKSLIQQCWHKYKDTRPDIEEVTEQLEGISKQMEQDSSVYCDDQTSVKQPPDKNSFDILEDEQKKSSDVSSKKPTSSSSTPCIRPHLTSHTSSDYLKRSFSWPSFFRTNSFALYDQAVTQDKMTRSMSLPEITSLELDINIIPGAQESLQPCVHCFEREIDYATSSLHGSFTSSMFALGDADSDKIELTSSMFFFSDSETDSGKGELTSSMFDLGDTESDKRKFDADQTSCMLSRHGSSRSTSTQTHYIRSTRKSKHRKCCVIL